MQILIAILVITAQPKRRAVVGLVAASLPVASVGLVATPECRRLCYQKVILVPPAEKIWPQIALSSSSLR